MRHYVSVADRELQKGEATDWGIVDGALKAANESAKDAAPFLHPRLSAVEHTGNPVDAFTEILKLIDGTSRGLPDPSKIPDRDPSLEEGDATTRFNQRNCWFRGCQAGCHAGAAVGNAGGRMA
jgi:hypothetical protein